jgi:hypothetical protein
MSKKDTLIELRQLIYQSLLAFIAGLDESERAAEGQPDNWAIKNALVHVALWDERLGINLQAIGKGRPATNWGNFNEVNARDFEAHRHDSWEQVEALLESSQQTLLAGLQSLDEAQMGQTDLLPGDQERPLWNRVSGSCITHPLIHMTDYLASSGRAQQALEMILELSQPMSKLDEGDPWQGLVIYNQACYYALTGHSTKAITLLGQALPLNPGLIEWSKQDSDLDSLRELPEFQALYPA